MVWDANRYIDAQAPWTLKKTDVGRMRTVLYVLMEVIRHVAILYQPLMPASLNTILDQLGVPSDERDFGQGGVQDKVGEGDDQADGGVSKVRGPGRRGRVKTIFILQTLKINQSLENTLPRVK